MQELLAEALERPAAERAAWLEAQERAPEVLAEARELLAADANAGRFLEVSAVSSWLDERRRHDAELQPGARLGPYRVIRALGRGGMGQVVLAERDDDTVRQRVAIKIADASLAPGHPERFLRERRILSGLDHASIARLLDGGTTELGQPYLVMEWVDGLPIDRACAGLPIERRLHLLRRVLAAVAHAHRHLVLHLDLKPGNILVDARGQPKLLDFGIAKLLSSADVTTAPGERPLTPEYASPEQRRGERLTTASDIYSLGRLLSRLLVPPPERLRRADQDRPHALSETARDPALRRRLRGDLDAIVARALAAEPADRYATVEALDADLARHLSGRPIRARHTAWPGRALRFVRRHRLPSGLAAALLVTCLAAALVVGRQGERLAQERRRAEVSRAEAEQVADFVLDLLGRLEPGELPGPTLSDRDLLDRGVAALDRQAAGPAVRARLLETLADAYRHRGDDAAAEPLRREAQELRRQTGLSR